MLLTPSDTASVSNIKAQLAEQYRPVRPQRLIGFRLRSERFALSLKGLRRVIPWSECRSDQQGMIVFTETEEIELLDVIGPIFQDKELDSSVLDWTPHYLVTFATSLGDLVGIPIHSEPVILRVTPDQIRDLPEHYLHIRNLGHAKGIVFPSLNSYLLLDLESLQLSLSTQDIDR